MTQRLNTVVMLLTVVDDTKTKTVVMLLTVVDDTKTICSNNNRNLKNIC